MAGFRQTTLFEPGAAGQSHQAIGLFQTRPSAFSRHGRESTSRCGATTATSPLPAAGSRGRQNGDQDQTGPPPHEARASDAFRRSVRRYARAAGERLRALRPAALAACAWFACCLFMLSAGLEARALTLLASGREARAPLARDIVGGGVHVTMPKRRARAPSESQSRVRVRVSGSWWHQSDVRPPRPPPPAAPAPRRARLAPATSAAPSHLCPAGRRNRPATHLNDRPARATVPPSPSHRQRHRETDRRRPRPQTPRERGAWSLYEGNS